MPNFRSLENASRSDALPHCHSTGRTGRQHGGLIGGDCLALHCAAAGALLVHVHQHCCNGSQAGLLVRLPLNSNALTKQQQVLQGSHLCGFDLLKDVLKCCCALSRCPLDDL